MFFEEIFFIACSSELFNLQFYKNWLQLAISICEKIAFQNFVLMSKTNHIPIEGSAMAKIDHSYNIHKDRSKIKRR